MENKIHVPNHQPVMCGYYTTSYDMFYNNSSNILWGGLEKKHELHHQPTVICQ